MNVIELYEQFTTTWEKIRANILSHAIAAGLLWLVGFAPALPDISLDCFTAIQAHPLYKMFEGVGFLALASLGVALAIWAYAIALKGIGQVLLSGIIILFPPVLSLSRSRKLVRRRALFNIAASLERGTYQPKDVEERMFELLAGYTVSQPEEAKGLLSADEGMQRDANTYLRNAAVFLAAWLSLHWFLPEGSALRAAIDAIFWRGFFVLAIFLLVARARLLFSLQLVLVKSAETVATLIQNDVYHADRLAAARSKPKPYWDLIHQYLWQDRQDRNPSLLDYLRAIIGWQPRDFDQKPIVAWAATMRTAFHKLRRFGWDEGLNRDYGDPAWVLRYVGWRLVRTLDAVWSLIKTILLMLGLWRP